MIPESSLHEISITTAMQTAQNFVSDLSVKLQNIKHVDGKDDVITAQLFQFLHLVQQPHVDETFLRKVMQAVSSYDFKDGLSSGTFTFCSAVYVHLNIDVDKHALCDQSERYNFKWISLT